MTHMCPAHGDGLSGRNDLVGIGYYIESLYTTRAKFLPTAPPLRIESQLGAPTQGGAVSLTPSFSRSSRLSTTSRCTGPSSAWRTLTAHARRFTRPTRGTRIALRPYRSRQMQLLEIREQR